MVVVANRNDQAGSFSTVEGFWKNYVHLKRPSNISTNVNVYLFRDADGHVPMWEVCLPPSSIVNPPDRLELLDHAWESKLLVLRHGLCTLVLTLSATSAEAS